MLQKQRVWHNIRPFLILLCFQAKYDEQLFFYVARRGGRTKHHWFKGGFKVLWRHHTIISILSIYLRQTVQNSADKVSRWAAIFSPNFAKVLSSNSCVTSQTDLAFSLPSAVKCIIFFPFTHRTSLNSIQPFPLHSLPRLNTTCLRNNYSSQICFNRMHTEIREVKALKDETLRVPFILSYDFCSFYWWWICWLKSKCL